jgi:peroxiredoxin Q/BCP
VREGIEVAGVSADTIEGNREWKERLHLPYPLLSDPERVAAEAFGGLRRLALGSWSLELFRRRTVLADRHGIVEAVWDRVKIRGHAAEVLTAARALARIEHPDERGGDAAGDAPGDALTPRSP